LGIPQRILSLFYLGSNTGRTWWWLSRSRNMLP